MFWRLLVSGWRLICGLARSYICLYGADLGRGELWRVWGITGCNFPPLPEGVILLAVFNC